MFDPASTRTITNGQIDAVTGIQATGIGAVRDPFPGNIVPVSRLDPVAVKLLDLFPAPNNPGIVNNMVTDPVKQINNATVDIRLDHNFSEKDQTFIRTSLAWEPQVLPTPLGGLAEGASNFAEGNQTNDVMNIAWSETHVFNASMVNEFRLGYSHVNTIRLQPYADQGGLNAQYGIQGIPDAPPNGGLTQINITGLNQLGGHNNLPLNEVNGNLQVHDNLSKQWKSHSLRVGFEMQRVKVGVFTRCPTRHGSLAECFGKYGLTVHPTKTKLAPFCPPSSTTKDQNGPGDDRPGTFDLLGFTHYWGRSSRGYWVIKLDSR